MADDPELTEPIPAEPAPRLTGRKLPEATLIERRCLDLWKEQGGAYRTRRDFCDALGPANGFNIRWVERRVQRQPIFGRKMKEIEEGRAKADTTEESRAPLLAQARWPDLEPWKGIYVERYRETGDREKAWIMVNKTWAEVRDELEMDDSFAAAVQQVDDEQIVKAEDAARRAATKGKGGAAAAAFLETQSNDFSKMKARQNASTPQSVARFTDYDVEATRHRARELFKRCLSIVPPRESNVEEPSGPSLASS